MFYICWLVAANVIKTGIAEGAAVPVAAVGQISFYPGAVCPDSVHGVGIVAHAGVN